RFLRHEDSERPAVARMRRHANLSPSHPRSTAGAGLPSRSSITHPWRSRLRTLAPVWVIARSASRVRADAGYARAHGREGRAHGPLSHTVPDGSAVQRPPRPMASARMEDALFTRSHRRTAPL